MNNLKIIFENIKSRNLDIALKLCEDNVTEKNEHIINNFKGVIHSLLNKQDLAEQFFKKSHDLYDKFEDPLKNLYLISIKKKNFDEAIKFSEKLCKLNNKNDLYFYQLAYAYELSNNNILAIENYEICINLDGHNKIKALNNIGTLYLRNNKAKISLKYFLIAYEINKNNKLIINNILLNYIKLKDEINSDKFFLISKSLDNKDIGFIYNQAQYYILKQKFDDAINILKKNKEKSRFLILLIDLYFNMGNFKDGEFLLDEIKNDIKKDINFYNYFGIRSLRNGNFEEGWKFYESRGSKITRYLKNIKDWNGENLENKSIVVFNEQGIGDALQFSKYVYSLSKIAKEVSFVVNNNIKDLFKTTFDNIKIQSKDNFVNNTGTYTDEDGNTKKTRQRLSDALTPEEDV